MQRSLAFGLVLASLGAPASAGVLFDAFAAINDDGFGLNAGEHAFYFPDLIDETTDWIFPTDLATGTGDFLLADGAAGIDFTGVLIRENEADPSAPAGYWSFDTRFDRVSLADAIASGSPKLELQDEAYEGPDAVDTSSYQYFMLVFGELTGHGIYAGNTITLEQTGPMFQLGEGASGKSKKPGFSGWYTWTLSGPLSIASFGDSTRSGRGDINVEFKERSNVPVPATVPLLLLGLVALAFIRR